jgi:hypothetical protein
MFMIECTATNDLPGRVIDPAFEKNAKRISMDPENVTHKSSPAKG